MANRRNPFEEMERLMNEMQRSMFGDSSFAHQSFGTPALGDRSAGDSALTGHYDGYDSHVSLESGDDGYLVVADLPGFETGEIDLRFHEGMLSIEAEHETSDEFESGGSHARSTRRRHVSEQVRLPEDVLADDITATYTNGVLEVRIPTADSGEDDGMEIDID